MHRRRHGHRHHYRTGLTAAEATYNNPTAPAVPKGFALDPTGAYLFAANQNSNTVVVFRVNPKNGRLTPTGEKVEVVSPVCVTFVAME